MDDTVMHRNRYSIASALVAIVFVAVGFAALREADEMWDRWLFYLTLGLLLVALFLAAQRTGVKRAFWIGFALFGWGFLSLSLIPLTEPSLITTKALSYLHQSKFFGIRAYRVRAILALDRMRAHNVSSDDITMALIPSSMGSFGKVMKDVEVMSISPAQLDQATGQASQTVEYLISWGAHYENPELYENIILQATPDGEILRIKDVAKFEKGSSFLMPGDAGTDKNFIHIGHTLSTLLAAWLGGVLSRWLWSVSVTPEVPTDDESRKRRFSSPKAGQGSAI